MTVGKFQILRLRKQVNDLFCAFEVCGNIPMVCLVVETYHSIGADIPLCPNFLRISKDGQNVFRTHDFLLDIDPKRS